MARCLQLGALAAKSEVPVVLLGETGTGKTLLAHAIHNSSARAGRPFIAFKVASPWWRGNFRELSHTVRAMTLFCNGSVILPEHVVFPPDLEPDRNASEGGKLVSSLASNNNEPTPNVDLSLASAVKRHVRVVYEQANQNQRRAAKLLGISRSTLARHLRGVAQE
jgi:DNA-binding NtrC family response regulator